MTPDEMQAEIERLRARLRETCQVLVACIGADGPKNAEEAATEAVAEIRRLRERDVETGELLIDTHRANCEANSDAIRLQAERDHATETLRQLIVLLADAKPVVATAEFAFGLVEKHLRERHPGLFGGDDE